MATIIVSCGLLFLLGVASAAMTATGGLLYGAFGAGAFWFMAALCAVALVFAPRLREAETSV